MKTKEELLTKLRAYTQTPDDEGIRYKEKIKNTLLSCPDLLYALNEKELESELFDENGNINWNPDTHEAYGEWDRYFGENANIRPVLFFPETQTITKNYLCYQVMFDEIPKSNIVQKFTEITFTILVHENNVIDKLTGIPRHDLIASIIRERFNWSNIFGMQARLISSKETVTDTHYIVRTLIFQVVDTNGICNTANGKTSIINNRVRR